MLVSGLLYARTSQHVQTEHSFTNVGQYDDYNIDIINDHNTLFRFMSNCFVILFIVKSKYKNLILIELHLERRNNYVRSETGK